ncbi:lipase family protein [Sorangium sp. So ce117]|uniref:lipase family protein n=1 Tax=Sorangium sp. So ce117 TaxID=3133277 RepID=UPI003F61503D
MRFTNNALLVDSEAFVCQSKDKKLVILAFGGTNPVNLIQLLLDATPKRDTFWTLGSVHGSFFRAALALWPTVKKLLLFALGGRSLCSGAESERSRTRDECKLRAGVAQDEPSVSSSEDDEESPPAVYITGHSLGGALAVLTAALIYRDRHAEPIWNGLRAIYTYGQPMVGSEDFAEKFKDIIGGRLFRHVYGDDFVPMLPSRTAGSFQHIGAELRSTEQGWLPQATGVAQARSFLTTVISGTAAFLAEQLPDFWTLPLLSPLRPLRPLLPLLPKDVWRRYFPQVSLYDHMPLNYLRTSRILPTGSELY